MPLSNFDKYYLNLPPLDRKNDFDQFWEKAVAAAKRHSLDAELTKNGRRSSSRFTVYDVSYRGFTGTEVTGELLVPRGKKKPKVIIYLHDYNSFPQHPQQHLDESAAYLFATMRGHGNITKPAEGEEKQATPGYMIENILDRDTYYVKAVYIDLLRSVDMLRLVPAINCSAIGVMGKGLGAAAAVFTAAYSDRVAALALDTPAFCHLSQSQNIAKSDATAEINEFVATVRGKKKQIKENLSYFDAMNFSNKIACPVMATVGFRDAISPPECIFSLFNHLQCEKTIEVYPEEGNTAGGAAQFKKFITWLVEQINK
ncbi:MAG: acetylxylan esterase [Spirochaetes bacterium]|nr:acetylxylan esterase [Spirochaetota bacterium]